MIVVVPGLTVGIMSAVVTLIDGGSALACAAAYFIGTAVGGIPPLLLRDLSGWFRRSDDRRTPRYKMRPIRPGRGHLPY